MPNKAPEPTITAVTIRAPSSTARASGDRGSSLTLGKASTTVPIMKTLAAFSNPVGAHLLIARLEGSGIRAFARDENVVSIEMGATNAFGGVKVDVLDEDYEKALAIRDETPADEKRA